MQKTFNLTYIMPQSRHSRQQGKTKPKTIKGLSKQDAKDWTKWLQYKKATYKLNK